MIYDDPSDAHWIGSVIKVNDGEDHIFKDVALSGKGTGGQMAASNASDLTRLIYNNQDDEDFLKTYGIIDFEIGCDYVKFTVEGQGANDSDGLAKDTILLSGKEIEKALCDLKAAASIRENNGILNLKPKGDKIAYFDFSAEEDLPKWQGVFMGNDVHFDDVVFPDGSTWKELGVSTKMQEHDAHALIEKMTGGSLEDWDGSPITVTNGAGTSISLSEGPDGMVKFDFEREGVSKWNDADGNTARTLYLDLQ